MSGWIDAAFLAILRESAIEFEQGNSGTTDNPNDCALRGFVPDQ
jgi:hypothetical protein